MNKSMNWVSAGFLLCSCIAACGGNEGSTEESREVSLAATATCAHDVLCTGGPLQGGSSGKGCTTTSGADGYCVPEVCADIASCCSSAWTNSCVQDMTKYTKAGGFAYNDCPSPTANPAPACSAPDAGSASDAGGAADGGQGACGECTSHTTTLSKSCDACTAAVCAQDSYCCNTKWDAQCVTEVATDCAAGTCSGGGIDAGSGTDSGGVDASAGDGGTPPTLPSPTLPAFALPSLTFGAFGDVRPANPNDTASYPDTILSAIFADMQADGLALAVDAGDHCFQSSISSGSYCHDQFVNHFMADRSANFSGRLLPTMGNHEGCGTDAATTGNCTSWSSGLVHDYLVDVVQPSTGQSSSPFYSVVAYGSWGTAKFVHVAANAWTTAQNTWLTSTLNVPTTYTFVVRHEPSNANTAPGVTPSESLYASHFSAGTLTLSITGHTHLVQLPGGTKPYGDEYGSTQAYETILGNAGAPLDAGPYYGYAVLTRRASDGAIVAQAYESVSSDGTTSLKNAADPSFRFAVNANGTANSNTSLP